MEADGWVAARDVEAAPLEVEDALSAAADADLHGLGARLTGTARGGGRTARESGRHSSRSPVRRYACCTATSEWTCPSLLPIVIVAAPNRSYDRRYVTARPGLRAERACVKLGKIIVPRRY